MIGKTIAILENRIGEQMAELVKKNGGIPFSAPALAEIPDIDVPHIVNLINEWESNQPDIFIFQTGVGVKALFSATDSQNLTDRFLEQLKKAKIIARGPKPVAILRSRNVRIDAIAKEPYTTVEVMAELDIENLYGKVVVVQKYGESNIELNRMLEEDNCKVIEISTYRWALPENTKPLRELIRLLEENKIDLTAFTSASQVYNLITFAKESGKKESLFKGLNNTLIASIGPICSAALVKNGIRVDIEPHPPKLGPFISAIKMRLSEIKPG